ncbi:TrkA family potassium uptake protein [Accumulibacter sp.]|uniref:potassium channel family protein n=1 Tax=Accumulibacter sp. TaxID=2053492 RepID=UPI0025EE36FE|nr:potassium channel protein [Accumulibacter sp.]MCM8594558.1 NAD-binding protein [Accumulibacter sp.]MCM8627406.1 NAD-binding protein [Accumulibacter sp.]MDS4048704.1 NAD-binding protein [Accumulibacter sp.]
MNASVFFLALRRMRAPLIVLIAIYAVSTLGLTLIPGIDAQGQPAPPMSFFHSFYFVSYTASTIGFGELPGAFSEAQRMWVTLVIFLSVIGWSYSIISLLALVQDKGFQQVLLTGRFVRRVRHLGEPFYIICGCGETGLLIARALDREGIRVVAIERSEARIQDLDLEDFAADLLTLCADAAQPQQLLMAGLRHRSCRGVLAMTDDDSANLAVAIASRVINPSLTIVARVASPAVERNMMSFGTHYVVNHFERFADHLAQAIHSPNWYRLVDLLTGLPGQAVPARHDPPAGDWVVCGYGRFGQAVVRNLERQGVRLTVIAPESQLPTAVHHVVGLGTEAEPLRQAGIETAVGIVAASDNDTNNLSIAMTAKELNPDLFVVVRQNRVANEILFEAFNADFTMVSSRIVARECLALITSPLLSRFLRLVRAWPDSRAAAVAERIEGLAGQRVPLVWGVRLNAADAPAVHRFLMIEDGRMTLEVLTLDPANRAERLPVVPLLLVRDGRDHELPEAAMSLCAGDELLFAGTRAAKLAQNLALDNRNALDYVLTGRDAQGWLWSLLSRGPRRRRALARAADGAAPEAE